MFAGCQNDSVEDKPNILLILTENEVAEELLTELHTWMDEMNVTASVENPHFNTDSMFVETRDKPAWIECGSLAGL